MNFLQLGRGVFRLLVVANPGIGSGEVDEWKENLWEAGDRLAAPWGSPAPQWASVP